MEIKKEIWRIKQTIEQAERTRNEWQEELDTVHSLLEAGPNAEASAVKPEIEAQVAAVEETLAPLREQLAALEAKLPQAPEPAAPKFDPEKHPLLKKNVEKSETKPIVFNAGDICEAQWMDKAWYKAKIQTVLGSVSNPKYHVRFIEYDDTMTVDRDSVRPIQNKRKRDPEQAAVPALPAPQAVTVTSTPQVISGPASVNPNAQAAKQAPAAENGEVNKRKLPNKKQLEKRVDGWKSWTTKGVGKKISQKESMFRTGTNVNSRVGFTGSGAGMTETHKRVRYDKKAEAEADHEDHVTASQSPIVRTRY